MSAEGSAARVSGAGIVAGIGDPSAGITDAGYRCMCQLRVIQFDVARHLNFPFVGLLLVQLVNFHQAHTCCTVLA